MRSQHREQEKKYELFLVIIQLLYALFTLCCVTLCQFVDIHGVREVTWQKVLGSTTRHVIDDMNISDCETVMQQRRITDKNNMKKETNTFITGEKDVKAICKDKPDGKTQSTNKFNVVVCTLTQGTYWGKIGYFQILTVECKDELPVHFYNHSRG
uniref:Ribonuclease A-domain domain-containing protein n=1 Tax=Poecilia mexicana TaxID=48701 RepID=A0A3B3YHE9_9TELE